MKLTNKELKKIVESVINNLSEDNFQLDLEDPNMPQKLNKLKNDITLFNKNEDSIEIKSDEDELSEQISFTKKELLKAVKKYQIDNIGQTQDTTQQDVQKDDGMEIDD